jgi:hypothetical protein
MKGPSILVLLEKFLEKLENKQLRYSQLTLKIGNFEIIFPQTLNKSIYIVTIYRVV